MTRPKDPISPTIVGGRPPVRRGARPGLGKNLEALLGRAARDRRFRRALLADPQAAAGTLDVDLSPTERALLVAARPGELATIIDGLCPPRCTRRGFIRVASIFTASAAWGASACKEPTDDLPVDSGPDDDVLPDRPDSMLSCDGIRPNTPSCLHDGTGDYWINLLGLTGLMHLPNSFRVYQTIPVCLAFHGEGQSCIDQVDLWRDVSDAQGFALVAVEWSGKSGGIEYVAGLTPAMLTVLRHDYCIFGTGQPLVATGIGTGGTIALSAALFYQAPITGALSIASSLPQDWATRTLENDLLAAAVAMMNLLDPRFTDLRAGVEVLASRGVPIEVRPLRGDLDQPTIDPAEAWGWIA